MEYGSYVQKQNQREWQMIIFGGRMQEDAHLVYGVEYICAEMEQAKAKRSTRNLAGYCKRKWTIFYAEAGRMNDFKKRQELYAKAFVRSTRRARSAAWVLSSVLWPYDKIKGFLTDDTGSINGTQFGIVKTWMER